MRNTWLKKDSLIYTGSISDDAFRDIKKELSRDTFWIYKSSGNMLQKIDSLILTCDEKAYVSNEIQGLQGKMWDDNLLDNSKLVTQAFFDKFKFQKGITSTAIYSFSKPIFLRDNTICFFYYHYSYSHFIGQGELSIYKKMDNQWKYLEVLFFSSK